MTTCVVICDDVLVHYFLSESSEW